MLLPDRMSSKEKSLLSCNSTKIECELFRYLQNNRRKNVSFPSILWSHFYSVLVQSSYLFSVPKNENIYSKRSVYCTPRKHQICPLFGGDLYTEFELSK